MHSALVLPLLLSAVVLSGVPRERDVVKKEYAVRPGGTLNVDMDRANIEVEVTEEDRVFIELKREARAKDKATAKKMLESHEYAFDKRGNDVYVWSRARSVRRSWRLGKPASLKITLTVRVPTRYNVEFSNGAGNLDVYELGGSVIGSTGAGNIVVEDVVGTISVSSGAGNIEISGGRGRVDVSTGAGNVGVYGQFGSAEVSTGAGNIDAEIRHQPEEGFAFSSGAGNVVVAIAEDIGATIRATARVGRAASDFPLKESGNFVTKTLEGSINGGGAIIELSCGVGNVTLKRL